MRKNDPPDGNVVCLGLCEKLPNVATIPLFCWHWSEWPTSVLCENTFSAQRIIPSKYPGNTSFSAVDLKVFNIFLTCIFSFHVKENIAENALKVSSSKVILWMDLGQSTYYGLISAYDKNIGFIA